MSEAEHTQALLDVASDIMGHAKKFGATSADVIASRSTDFEVKVADGKIVNLTQAVAKGMGLRVFVGKHLGFCTTSDFSKDSLEHAAKRAVEMARESAEDPFNGLPEVEPGRVDVPEDLELYDPAVVALSPDEKIRWAHALEESARAADPRVRKFRDSGVSNGESHTVLVTSDGAVRTGRFTGISLWCNPIAEADGELQTEFWYDSRTHVGDLESVESIGRKAAERAARMLGAKSVPTTKASVIFEPSMAVGFLGGILGAIDGDRVHKRASFLAEKLGEEIAVSGITLVDDPLLKRGSGSTPFDSEGLQTYRKKLVDRGRLTMFLYDSYTARKVGVEPTANGRRGYASPPSAGTFNFYAEAGDMPAEEIWSGVERGLVMTRGLGRGLNTVSGEYSRGANGLWIENGEVVHPVQEVTIAGDYLTMLGNIDAIGSDLELRGSSGAPTIRVADVTISGV
ncbi:MAG: TldD/PmbA family protein [Myxococcota bacterium]